MDLGTSPATNTLPVRRIGLRIGEHGDLTAAWVRFPELKVQSLAQRYARVGPPRYLYESRDGQHRVLFDVDEVGLVTRYAGWDRIA